MRRADKKRERDDEEPETDDGEPEAVEKDPVVVADANGVVHKEVRDERELYDECLPALMTLPCERVHEAPSSCDAQIVYRR